MIRIIRFSVYMVSLLSFAYFSFEMTLRDDPNYRFSLYMVSLLSFAYFSFAETLRDDPNYQVFSVHGLFAFFCLLFFRERKVREILNF